MKNYEDLYNKYKIKYLNLKNSIGGDFIYRRNIKSSQRFLITELHLTNLGATNLELIKTKVSNFIEKYNSLNSEKVPFESQYNIKGCIIPAKLQIDKNIANVTKLSPSEGHELKNNKTIFDMCSISIETELEQVVQNPEPLFISYYDERQPIKNINLGNLNYLGYFLLPFYKTKEEKEKKKDKKNKVSYVFLLFEKGSIIEIFRPNSKYICPNTFCEYNNFLEYQLDYLKYFSTNSSVYTYKLDNLILFSHYSLEDMKQLFSRVDLSDKHKEKLNIIPCLIDGVIHNYKFISNTDFIKKRFEILKQNMKETKYNKKKYVTRPDYKYNNQFIDTIYPDFNRLLPECNSHSALGNIKFFFRDLDACIPLINTRISNPDKHITKQILDNNIQDLKKSLIDNDLTNINHDDDIETSDNLWFKVIKQTSLIKQEEIDKFFSERLTLLHADLKQKEYIELFKVSNINQLFNLYSLSGEDCNSMEKPLLYSNKDYTSVIEEDITQIEPFLPDLIEKTIEYKKNSNDEIKSNILARRLNIISDDIYYKEPDNYFVQYDYTSRINKERQQISDPRKFLYSPFWTRVDRSFVNKKLHYSVIYNKIFIQCNEFKDMIFPFLIIFNNIRSRYVIMKSENLIFLGYFQMYFRTKNDSKILYTYYIFYHLDKRRLEIISQYGNEIRINQSIADKMSLLYVEIFMIYYENKQKHFYCDPSKPEHYYFSKFTLDEIIEKIKEKFSDDKISSLSSREQKYIKDTVIPFFYQLEEYVMIMTDNKNINFIKKE